jgi:hypothetical protein
LNDEAITKAHADADELLSTYGVPTSRTTAQRLLAMAWLLGSKEGLEEGSRIAQRAFDRLAQATLTGNQI